MPKTPNESPTMYQCPKSDNNLPASKLKAKLKKSYSSHVTPYTEGLHESLIHAER